MTTAVRARGRRWVWSLALGAVAALVAVRSVPGQDAGKKGEAVKPEGALEARDPVTRWKREAAEYRIVAGTGPESVLRLQTEPVLHWSNPERTTDDGLVFLWLRQGRPEAVACFYRVRWEGRLVEAHELVSLAPVGLSATRGGRAVWSPPAPGVTPRLVAGAPSPARTPVERLRQVRTLAREFRTFVDVEKSRTELRQLSKPVYHYEGESDGALFAFVLTTDPEALLLIDDRPGANGPAWHYAFARMSNHSLSARHRDRVVWEVDRDPDDGNPTKPFCSRWDVGPKP